jgi:hypothetical protein
MTNQMPTIEATLIVTEIVGTWTEGGDAGMGRAIIQKPLRLRHRRGRHVD